MDKKLVFIASGGRTGTQFLGDFLRDAIDDCWSEHESDVFYGLDQKSLRRIREYGLWNMVVGRALGLTGIRAAGMRFLSGKTSLPVVARRLRQERERIYSRRPESLVIDSYWRWWMFAGVIDRIWPSARTIGIVRDPKDWIPSVQAHHGGTGGLRWTSHFPFGPLTPDKIGDREWSVRWDRLSPVGRLAWEWRLINSRLANATTNDLCRIYRFEDLFDSSGDTLDDLIDFARHHGSVEFARRSFDHHALPPRNMSSARKGAWQDWSVSDRAVVDELCGELCDRLGYSRTLASSRRSKK